MIKLPLYSITNLLELTIEPNVSITLCVTLQCLSQLFDYQLFVSLVKLVSLGMIWYLAPYVLDIHFLPFDSGYILKGSLKLGAGWINKIYN